MIYAQTTITKKGQITIPAVLRHKFKLKPGTKAIIYEDQGDVKIKPGQDIFSLQGSVKPTPQPFEPQKNRQQFINYLSQRKNAPLDR